MSFLRKGKIINQPKTNHRNRCTRTFSRYIRPNGTKDSALRRSKSNISYCYEDVITVKLALLVNLL